MTIANLAAEVSLDGAHWTRATYARLVACPDCKRDVILARSCRDKGSTGIDSSSNDRLLLARPMIPSIEPRVPAWQCGSSQVSATQRHSTTISPTSKLRMS